MVAIALTQECTTDGSLVMKADMARWTFECVLMYFCFLFISPAPFVIRVDMVDIFFSRHARVGGSNAIQVLCLINVFNPTNCYNFTASTLTN